MLRRRRIASIKRYALQQNSTRRRIYMRNQHRKVMLRRNKMFIQHESESQPTA
ncbi:hypothetical protein [Algicola sagamiensis]|uniref:hypothetical protein n=1 Tax=Algicola sagamiensis TaxID=163869 RepID=UPI00037C431D|nr:hypothetical protein [Algicola sagamiensis]